MGYLPWGTTAIKLLLDPNAPPFVSRQQERRGAAAEREGKRGKMRVIGRAAREGQQTDGRGEGGTRRIRGRKGSSGESGLSEGEGFNE